MSVSGGESAALKAEPGHEPDPDASGAPVALHDSDLREVPCGVGHRPTVTPAWLHHQGPGHELPGIDADHANPVHDADAEVLG